MKLQELSPYFESYKIKLYTKLQKIQLNLIISYATWHYIMKLQELSPYFENYKIKLYTKLQKLQYYIDIIHIFC